LQEIELSNYGEVFLNPDLLRMFEHAAARNVVLHIGNGANFNYVRPDVLEGLVKYRVRTLRCSIDGATEETYQKYRVRGRLAKVLENLQALNVWKKTYQSALPQLTWQFVVFGHNQHEIQRAWRMAKALGMHFFLKLSWDPDFSPVDSEHLRQNGMSWTNREEYRQQTGVEYARSICHQLWQGPQINWDGRNLGCCYNYWGDFGGNAFRDGLEATFNHDRMVHARAMVQGRAEPRPDIPCTDCALYKSMRASRRWISDEELSDLR
jgi:MoaA/NifB/PqqE/SkfB family radical SAM enzyme